MTSWNRCLGTSLKSPFLPFEAPVTVTNWFSVCGYVSKHERKNFARLRPHLAGGWVGCRDFDACCFLRVLRKKRTWPCTLRRTGQHRPHTFGQPGWIRPRHSRGYLPLLPSGPDGVRTRLLRGVQPAPELDTACSAPGPSKGDSTPLKRISGYRAPLAPRLARPRGFFGTKKYYINISNR